jgi:hypothetical protein
MAKPTTFGPGQGRASRPFECGIHNITYEAARAGCPLCESEREVNRLRGAMKDVHNQLKILTEQNLQLKVQTDIVSAIREAALILDDNDLAFLKSVLYEWRDQKSVALKTTHGPRKKKREIPPPNGFIAMPRNGDPYGHLCTSVGGLAIAEYFDEATNTVGPANAMTLLVRGMANHLPGAMR